MVNEENPDYQMCVRKKYLLRDSHGIVRPLKWWHGSGGLLDYSNPDAVAWWHQKMNQVLDAGVDGFKCDGTDPYVIEYSITGGALGFNDQEISYRDYADMYYRDFFDYTREKRGGDAGLIMSRPVDCLADKAAKACWGYSPKNVMYSGWVGDDDSSFLGFKGCLNKVIYSAWDGYANFGCDVGGYRHQDLSSKNLFLRWAQAMSFLPLMENGGGGEHRPWMYDKQTLDIYRKFAVQHHRLSPYLQTIGANAMDSGSSSIIPVAVRENHAVYDVQSSLKFPGVFYPQPSTYSYRLGPDVLIHPIVHDFENGTEADSVHMIFPNVDSSDAPTQWLDWWHPQDARLSHLGGTSRRTIVPLESYPVYVRRNSLLPLESRIEEVVSTVFTWFGPSSSSDSKHPVVADMRESSSESNGNGARATVYFSSENSMEGSISSHSGAGGFEWIGVTEPSSVDVSSWPTALCEYHYTKVDKTFRVVCRDLSGGIKVHVEGITPSF